MHVFSVVNKEWHVFHFTNLWTPVFGQTPQEKASRSFFQSETLLFTNNWTMGWYGEEALTELNLIMHAFFVVFHFTNVDSSIDTARKGLKIFLSVGDTFVYCKQLTTGRWDGMGKRL